MRPSSNCRPPLSPPNVRKRIRWSPETAPTGRHASDKISRTHRPTNPRPVGSRSFHPRLRLDPVIDVIRTDIAQERMQNETGRFDPHAHPRRIRPRMRDPQRQNPFRSSPERKSGALRQTLQFPQRRVVDVYRRPHDDIMMPHPLWGSQATTRQRGNSVRGRRTGGKTCASDLMHTGSEGGGANGLSMHAGTPYGRFTSTLKKRLVPRAGGTGFV